MIAIRVDAAQAVSDFLDLLRQQAEAGETEAPAKPANRALFRELAPFRLVEYEYVDPAVGPVEGAFVGFPDGGVYGCGELIPEEAVDALVDQGGAIPPIYLYVLFERPAPAAALRRYLNALAEHLGMPLVAVTRGEDGRPAAGIYPESDANRNASSRRAALSLAATEISRHLSKKQVMDQHVACSHLPDGRAYAVLSHRFARRILEFPSAAERDDFVAWTQRFCALVQAKGEAVVRPAEPCAAPPPTFNLIRVSAPRSVAAGDPWAAFSDAGEPSAEAIALAQGYWAEVIATIEGVMAAEQAARLQPAGG